MRQQTKTKTKWWTWSILKIVQFTIKILLITCWCNSQGTIRWYWLCVVIYTQCDNHMFSKTCPKIAWLHEVSRVNPPTQHSWLETFVYIFGGNHTIVNKIHVSGLNLLPRNITSKHIPNVVFTWLNTHDTLAECVLGFGVTYITDFMVIANHIKKYNDITQIIHSIKKYTFYVTLLGKLWGVCHEYFGQNLVL